MIKSFSHEGLERFFLTGSKSGIQAQHASRLRLIFARLNGATSPQDMALPGLRLHELTGNRRGVWAVDVSANWRITFCFVGVDAEKVHYEDYH
ncbi:MAG: type II toxin-antitoxin system RelE/ParE family toxin [Nitrococcus sp.]|nr:type II toxin-antitoxin system RelE/ParE family toxin [Nitrococcus sp.]